MTYLHLILVHYKGKGHAHFNSEYLGNDEKTLLLPSNRKSCMGFMAYLNLTSNHLKGLDNCNVYFNNAYL